MREEKKRERERRVKAVWHESRRVDLTRGRRGMSRHQEGGTEGVRTWRRSDRQEGGGRRRQQRQYEEGSVSRRADGSFASWEGQTAGPGINSTRQGRVAHDPPAALLTKLARHPSAGELVLCLLVSVLLMFHQTFHFPRMSTPVLHSLLSSYILTSSTFHVNYF